MAAYYNEIDLYAAEWLRNLIKAGHIADGEVDTRSIIDVQPKEIKDFDQCHFFAGIAGWSHALRLSGWEDDRKIWTGSCPCQPFSVAGQGKGTDDPRHLWPHFFRLIRGCRPQVIMGEQVAGAAGYGWLDGVRSDLESEDYAIEAVDTPACSVNAPHIRSRLYWVANANSGGCRETRERRTLDEIQGRELHTGMPVEERSSGDMADTRYVCRGNGAKSVKSELTSITGSRSSCNDLDDTTGSGLERYSQSECFEESGVEGKVFSISGARRGALDMADAECRGRKSGSISTSHTTTEFIAQDSWGNAIWLNGADGKTRRVKSGVCLLAHGVPARVGKLRAYGNAIVPPLAAEVIKAFMEETE